MSDSEVEFDYGSEQDYDSNESGDEGGWIGGDLSEDVGSGDFFGNEVEVNQQVFPQQEEAESSSDEEEEEQSSSDEEEISYPVKKFDNLLTETNYDIGYEYEIQLQPGIKQYEHVQKQNIFEHGQQVFLEDLNAIGVNTDILSYIGKKMEDKDNYTKFTSLITITSINLLRIITSEDMIQGHVNSIMKYTKNIEDYKILNPIGFVLGYGVTEGCPEDKPINIEKLNIIKKNLTNDNSIIKKFNEDIDIIDVVRYARFWINLRKNK